MGGESLDMDKFKSHEYKVDGYQSHNGSYMVLSGFQGILNGDILHPTINPSHWNLNVGRIP